MWQNFFFFFYSSLTKWVVGYVDECIALIKLFVHTYYLFLSYVYY